MNPGPHLSIYFYVEIVLVLVRVSVVEKRHHHHSNFYRGKHLVMGGPQFRGSVLERYSGKPDGMQEDTVLER